MERRFIESVRFPFREVSEASAVEKGPGRPPHWEMVFWWTRKPLISARAVIAGCLLPENTNPRNFLKAIGIGREKKSAHNVRPWLSFPGVKLLDPFAGFGSIPLEAMRLGLDATAVELLPVAYVFLKAVLEYPVKYGRSLVKDVEKWGNWVTEKLKEDPLIMELYDEDVAVYIGSWEVKCPTCGKWFPIVGNWWLARVKGAKGYERLAWMEPEIEGDDVKIRVVDLNKTLSNESVRAAKVEGAKVTVINKEFRVPESNVEARRERAVCLYCSQPIMQIDPQTGRHYTETKDLPKDVKDRLEGYIKFALKLYNQEIGFGEASFLPSWTNGMLARPRLMVKLRKDSGFESCDRRDQEKLELAKEKILTMLEQNEPDVPIELVAPFGVTIRTIAYGFNTWHKHFDPRQLFTLITIVKTIREAGKNIEIEKLSDGWDKEEARRYAEAIVSYLSLSLIRYADYNSVTTSLHPSNPMGVDVTSTLAIRRPCIRWNFVETSPFADVSRSWIRTQGSWIKSLVNCRNALDYLSSSLSRDSNKVSSSSLVDLKYDKEKEPSRNNTVLLEDATVLNRLNMDEKFDLIITDPPYYDDVQYSELSDLYYVWLKRALGDNTSASLKPNFLVEAFFEKIGDDWVEVSTQWEKYALSEVSLNPLRLGSNTTTNDGIKHFQNLLDSSFVAMTSRLRENGLLVTYYAHTSPDAWKALLEAGWAASGLRVTNAFPLSTESTQSIVSRGKLSMDTSIIIVWRKGSYGSVEASSLYSEMVEESARKATELIDSGAIGRDLVIGTLAAALAVATMYREVKVMGKINVRTLIDGYVYPATYLGMTKAYAQKAEIKDGVKSPDAMFYLLVKSILPGAKEKILESTDARIFSIGTSLNLNQALKQKILRYGKKEEGAQVAKAKTLMLVEPTSTEKSRLAELLEAREIGTREPVIKCVVDGLHVLEYFAVAYPREEFNRRLEELKAKYPAHMEEALSISRILARILPEKDVEKTLCNRILEHLTPRL